MRIRDLGADHAEPLCIEDGLAIAPERPGHGIEFDWKGLDALRGPRGRATLSLSTTSLKGAAMIGLHAGEIALDERMFRAVD